ncbi:hypothetical protein KCH_70060 [Kitasatospora cheerisanensis KCTC 2395]|uniref:Uncharacterized protein n=1 Tax=Kitasatospora cheerisanensis KCTC 2395 TaxID=1348663 RepID=A0A066YTH5_9ACTN|nr:hypothetical protein KCH_70060 [Kitasatospora cheerisanensis KCTC 2395]
MTTARPAADDPALARAVRGGDPERVHALILAGADPEAVDEHGTPLLFLAVDAFDETMADTLLQWGARPDRPDALGRTPLHRSIELGALDLVRLLVAQGAAMWLPDGEGRDALTLARHWHGVDLRTELYHRTGRPGPVLHRTVRSSIGSTCEELSLDDAVFRTGHSAILTWLEPKYGTVTPFEGLLARALAEADPEHEVWCESVFVLSARRDDPETWRKAAALRESPDPLQRCFGAEVVRLLVLFDEREDCSSEGGLIDLFLTWVAVEPDPRVTHVLATGLAETGDPRCDATLRTLARHPDARVRISAVIGLSAPVRRGDARPSPPPSPSPPTPTPRSVSTPAAPSPQPAPRPGRRRRPRRPPRRPRPHRPHRGRRPPRPPQRPPRRRDLEHPRPARRVLPRLLAPRRGRLPPPPPARPLTGPFRTGSATRHRIRATAQGHAGLPTREPVTRHPVAPTARGAPPGPTPLASTGTPAPGRCAPRPRRSVRRTARRRPRPR